MDASENLERFRAEAEGQECARIRGSAQYPSIWGASSPFGHGPTRDTAPESGACELIRFWFKKPKIFQKLEQAKEQGREHQELSKSEKV